KRRHDLNLYANYPANPKITNCLQRNTTDHQRMTKGIGKQWTNKIRTHDKHDHHDHRRQGHQQHHGEPSLCGMDPNLTHDLETFADDVGQVVENLSQVAARLALQHHCGDEELYIDQWNTFRQIDQRV